jgi:predicted helicase
VGVGITLAVRRKGAFARLRYHRVPEMWRKREKLDFLAQGEPVWETLTPDTGHTWLIPEHADEYRHFLGIEEVFELRSRGLETTRDDVVYDFDREKLETRIKEFISTYNTEVDRHARDSAADFRTTSSGAAASRNALRGGSTHRSIKQEFVEAYTGRSPKAGCSSTRF